MQHITIQDVVMFGLFVIAGYGIKYGKRIFENVVKNQLQGGLLTRQEHDVYTRINNKLLEVLIGTDADRAYLFLFHNGEIMARQISRKKISCMFEQVSEGTSAEVSKLKNLDVTSVWWWLHNFLCDKDEDLGKGVSILKNNMQCSDCSTEQRVLHFDRLKMSSNVFTATLSARGILSMVQTLVYDEDENIIGVLGVDYCVQVDTHNFNQCDLCRESARMSLMLKELSKVKKTLWQYIKTLLEK